MGSTQSVQGVGEEHTDDEEEEEDNDDDDEEEEEESLGSNIMRQQLENNQLLVKKVLEQEPEMLPCYASATPLSPQLSSLGTPRMGPSIKVWDPYNVLAPPPPPVSFSFDDDRSLLQVYFISHGECDLNSRPDIVAGRCDGAVLTSNGKRQARALAVFLNSQAVRFNAVYCSPLDRARSMAHSVCQEMNFAVPQIQSSDALTDLSMGDWEGCPRSEIYTPEVLSLMERYQPDFCAPSGESLRQLEFRMVQFLNGTILGLPEKFRSEFSVHQNESQGFTHHNNHALTNSVHARDGASLQLPNWDTLQRQRHMLTRKMSGKSRLQFVSNLGEHDADDEMSPREASQQSDLHDLNVRSSSSPSTCVGVFTHSLPIKCLMTGLLGCSPVMSHRMCIEDSSVTVLQHSWKSGWQIKRLNDTAHLMLL